MSDYEKAAQHFKAALESIERGMNILKNLSDTKPEEAGALKNRVAELEADLASYRQRLARPKGPGGRPLKSGETPAAPKQTRVQKEIHETRGTEPASDGPFFKPGDSLGSAMLRGAVKKEERREARASKNKRRQF
jgi:hypothetical protein